MGTKKKFKKNLVYVLFMLCSCICFFSASYYQASTSITLECWRSNHIAVAYWSDSPKIYFSNLSSSFNISTYVSNAVSSWRAYNSKTGNYEGVYCNITTSPRAAHITYYGGTRAQLALIGMYYTDDVLGLTEQTFTSKATGKLGSTTYYIAEMTDATASVCQEAGEYCQLVATHECGHALGWIGHSYINTDIMYTSPENSNDVLSTTELKHLKQIYDAMQ